MSTVTKLLNFYRNVPRGTRYYRTTKEGKYGELAKTDPSMISISESFRGNLEDVKGSRQMTCCAHVTTVTVIVQQIRAIATKSETPSILAEGKMITMQYKKNVPPKANPLRPCPNPEWPPRPALPAHKPGAPRPEPGLSVTPYRFLPYPTLVPCSQPNNPPSQPEQVPYIPTEPKNTGQQLALSNKTSEEKKK